VGGAPRSNQRGSSATTNPESGARRLGDGAADGRSPQRASSFRGERHQPDPRERVAAALRGHTAVRLDALAGRAGVGDERALAIARELGSDVFRRAGALWVTGTPPPWKPRTLPGDQKPEWATR
jgi:hypothetical protein